MNPILLVDDKEENLYYLQRLLTAHAYTVETARNGEEALHKAKKNLPGLVISDLLMPVIDGYTFLRIWKSDDRLNPIPFIVYTATYTDPGDQDLAFKLGADDFILKPSKPDVFIARVQAVLEKSDAKKSCAPKPDEQVEKSLLQEYSETLIKKLEQKTLQLQQANRELQRELEERKRTEEALVKSDERFRNLLQIVSSVAVQSYTMDGTTLYWNRASELFYGYSAEEAVGKNLLDLIIPPDLKADVRKAIDTMAETGEPIAPGELNLIRKEGSSINVYSSHAIVNIPGREPEFFCIDIDLTERKKAEAQIREQAALLDAANEAIYVQDLRHNKVLFWNKGAERIYGWSQKEAVGKSVIDLIYKNRAGYEEALSELKKNGEWRGEFVHICKNDIPVVIESNWTLLKDESGNPKSILTINSDITDKKDLEKQFLRAQRMESIGTLAGGIAHDLNNMLAPILMAIELLRNDIVTNPQGLNLLNSMQDSAQRGANLVKQVLSFSRGVEGERLSINPVHIVRELITVLRETFPKSISISFKADVDSWLITGDPTQLHQVLLNMCVNARDAMPGGGELRIRMENRTLDEQFAAGNISARAGTFVLFRVSDTGSGMPQQVVDKIFEPFFTTKSFGKGTGLGLSTTLAIVKSHKGFIDVTSEEGAGTTFDIYFPAEPDDQTSSAEKPAPNHLPAGGGEWVLAVEDEEAIRKVIKHTLEHFGYRVLLAENGKEAVQIYSEHQAKISVVLTDMAMPVMDGPAVILAIKKLNPDARIIMSSGFSALEDITGEIRDLVTACIPKPYTADVILNTLHRILHPDNTEK